MRHGADLREGAKNLGFGSHDHKKSNLSRGNTDDEGSKDIIFCVVICLFI